MKMCVGCVFVEDVGISVELLCVSGAFCYVVMIVKLLCVCALLLGGGGLFR
jgi:hypothetical protein